MNQEWKKRLKEAREAKGLKKTAFAKAVGVSNPTVTDWEKSVDLGGIGEITGPKLIKVCQVLNISAEWLFGGLAPESTFEVSPLALDVAKAFDRLTDEGEKRAVLRIMGIETSGEESASEIKTKEPRLNMIERFGGVREHRGDQKRRKNS